MKKHFLKGVLLSVALVSVLAISVAAYSVSDVTYESSETVRDYRYMWETLIFPEPLTEESLEASNWGSSVAKVKQEVQGNGTAKVEVYFDGYESKLIYGKTLTYATTEAVVGQSGAVYEGVGRTLTSKKPDSYYGENVIANSDFERPFVVLLGTDTTRGYVAQEGGNGYWQTTPASNAKYSYVYFFGGTDSGKKYKFEFDYIGGGKVTSLSNGSANLVSNQTLASSTEWEHFETEFTAPANSNTLNITLESTGNGIGFKIDNLTVQEIFEQKFDAGYDGAAAVESKWLEIDTEVVLPIVLQQGKVLAGWTDGVNVYNDENPYVTSYSASGYPTLTAVWENAGPGFSAADVTYESSETVRDYRYMWDTLIFPEPLTQESLEAANWGSTVVAVQQKVQENGTAKVEVYFDGYVSKLIYGKTHTYVTTDAVVGQSGAVYEGVGRTLTSKKPDSYYGENVIANGDFERPFLVLVDSESHRAYVANDGTNGYLQTTPQSNAKHSYVYFFGGTDSGKTYSFSFDYIGGGKLTSVNNVSANVIADKTLSVVTDWTKFETQFTPAQSSNTLRVTLESTGNGIGFKIDNFAVQEVFEQKFDANYTNASEIESKWITIDTEVELPTVSRAGYTLSGWTDGENIYNAENPYITSYSASGYPTLTAVWTEKVPEAGYYSVTWLSGADDATGFDYLELASGEAVNYIPNSTFKRTGYTLAGWQYSKTGEIFPTSLVAEKFIPIMPNENVTFTAKWVKALNDATGFTHGQSIYAGANSEGVIDFENGEIPFISAGILQIVDDPRGKDNKVLKITKTSDYTTIGQYVTLSVSTLAHVSAEYMNVNDTTNSKYLQFHLSGDSINYPNDSILKFGENTTSGVWKSISSGRYFHADVKNKLLFLQSSGGFGLSDGTYGEIYIDNIKVTVEGFNPTTFEKFSIRTTSPAGLRVPAFVSKTLHPFTDEYGFIVTIKSNLDTALAENSGMTAEEMFVLDNTSESGDAAYTTNSYGLKLVHGVSYSKAEGIQKVKNVTNGSHLKDPSINAEGYYFNAAIIGIPATYYNADISIRSYVKIGQTYYYGNIVTGNIDEVAWKLYETPEFETDASLNKVVTDIIEGKELP